MHLRRELLPLAGHVTAAAPADWTALCTARQAWLSSQPRRPGITPCARPLRHVSMDSLFGVSGLDLSAAPIVRNTAAAVGVRSTPGETTGATTSAIVAFGQLVSDPDELAQEVKAAVLSLAAKLRVDLLQVQLVVSSEGLQLRSLSLLRGAAEAVTEQHQQTAYGILMSGYQSCLLEKSEVVKMGLGVWRVTQAYCDLETCCYQTRVAHYYLVEGSHSVAVIDAGLGKISISDALEMAGIRGKSVVGIMTHAHDDHIAGFRGTGIPVKVHHKELAAVVDLGNLSCVTDNELIDLGDVEIRVVATAGHTAGSISLATDTHLFTGDAVLTGCLTFVTDLEQFGLSLSRIETESIGRLVCPGHEDTGLDICTIREAREAFATMVGTGVLDKPMGQAEVEGLIWDDASALFAEWDEVLGSPVVQVGDAFSFVRLTDTHDV